MASEVLFETRGPILIITFNRPEQGNALTSFMAKAIAEKLKAISDDRTIRAILLRGAGDNFMDGHEISLYAGDTNIAQEMVFQKVQFFYALIRDFQSMERPVIAALDGRVSGAGFSIMLACDLAIASRRTVFNPDFTPHAMVPDGGATFFLPRKIGAAKATELFLLNEDFTAAQAEKWCLINRMVEDADLESEALAFAEKIASGPTRIYGATKRLINKAFELDLQSQLSLEATTWSACMKTFDFREAMKAYLAHREPKFTGA